jgi:hypothetical protein
MMDEGLFHADVDMGEFRYAAARYVKNLICARCKCEPGFLSDKLSVWGVQDIDQSKGTACEYLYLAARDLAHLNTAFILRCGSGGVRIGELDPAGRLVQELAFLAEIGYRGGPEHNGALLEAVQILSEGKPLDWDQLVKWDRLDAIRSDLDLLPHPRASKSLPRLTLDPDSRTITVDGKSHPAIDPTAFLIFDALWEASPGKLSSIDLHKQRALGGKNISRELKKLPKALRILVKSAGGSGYWIQLLEASPK